MRSVGAFEAKTHLAALLDIAELRDSRAPLSALESSADTAKTAQRSCA